MELKTKEFREVIASGRYLVEDFTLQRYEWFMGMVSSILKRNKNTLMYPYNQIIQLGAWCDLMRDAWINEDSQLFLVRRVSFFRTLDDLTKSLDTIEKTQKLLDFVKAVLKHNNEYADVSCFDEAPGRVRVEFYHNHEQLYFKLLKFCSENNIIVVKTSLISYSCVLKLD